MSLYQVKYKLNEKDKTHWRFYNALSKATAKDMFRETVSDGSLAGEDPKIVEIVKKEPKN